MQIGYARTSTLDQDAGLDAQIRDLKALGIEKIFSEQTSAVGQRPQLDAALIYLREGDTLVVTKLDRLARSTAHLGSLLNQIDEAGAGLRILAMDLDTNTATGKLMLNVMISVAQFEREMMLERQREGIAKAKAEGKYKGRKPTAMDKSDQIREMANQGITKRDIAKRLGVGERSVYRALAQST